MKHLGCSDELTPRSAARVSACMCAVNVAGAQGAEFQIAELVEQKQRMIAGAGMSSCSPAYEANKGVYRRRDGHGRPGWLLGALNRQPATHTTCHCGQLAMIAAPWSVNRAHRSRSLRKRESCHSRRSSAACLAAVARAAAACSRARLRRRYQVEREMPSASQAFWAFLRGMIPRARRVRSERNRCLLSPLGGLSFFRDRGH